MKTETLSTGHKLEVIEIGHMMHKAGLPGEFVTEAVSIAFEFEGVYDLMKMWESEQELTERNEIVSDIQELIDDCNQSGMKEETDIRFDDLDAIVKNIRAYKDNLRAEVDQWGGITRLAEATGIPQPSLSRFFNSASRPHRNTLFKIAKALNVSSIKIEFNLR